MTSRSHGDAHAFRPNDGAAIAVFISGSGTTLRNLIQWQSRGQLIPRIALVVSSDPKAAGRTFAREAQIPLKDIDWRTCPDAADFSQLAFDACRSAGVPWVALGGFLRKLAIPSDFVNRVVNIHPSLIPAFCGKGFYGARVHRAVLEQGCKVSGCTVHFVDDAYDHGPIIAQVPVAVLPHDTPESLAARVFAEECQIYPRVLNLLARGKITVSGRLAKVDESLENPFGS